MKTILNLIAVLLATQGLAAEGSEDFQKKVKARIQEIQSGHILKPWMQQKTFTEPADSALAKPSKKIIPLHQSSRPQNPYVTPEELSAWSKLSVPYAKTILLFYNTESRDFFIRNAKALGTYKNTATSDHLFLRLAGGLG